MPRYIVMTSSARSPAAKRWSGYRNIALVELQPGYNGTPRMISARARGVASIVDYHHSVFVGRLRGAGVDLVAALNLRAAELNGTA